MLKQNKKIHKYFPHIYQTENKIKIGQYAYKKYTDKKTYFTKKYFIMNRSICIYEYKYSNLSLFTAINIVYVGFLSLNLY